MPDPSCVLASAHKLRSRVRNSIGNQGMTSLVGMDTVAAKVIAIVDRFEERCGDVDDGNPQGSRHFEQLNIVHLMPLVDAHRLTSQPTEDVVLVQPYRQKLKETVRVNQRHRQDDGLHSKTLDSVDQRLILLHKTVQGHLWFMKLHRISSHRLPIEVTVVATIFKHSYIAILNLVFITVDILHALGGGAAKTGKIQDPDAQLLLAAFHKPHVRHLINRLPVGTLLVRHHTPHDRIPKCANLIFHLFFSLLQGKITMAQAMP